MINKKDHVEPLIYSTDKQINTQDWVCFKLFSNNINKILRKLNKIRLTESQTCSQYRKSNLTDCIKSANRITLSVQQKSYTNCIFFVSDWCDWCQCLFFEMFFNGSTWFRGHELHFVQVREKGSCQTKIPNWRCKWTVDNTDIVSVFIRFDSPSSSPSSSVSMVAWKVEPCQTVSGWLTGWNVIKCARRFPQTET